MRNSKGTYSTTAKLTMAAYDKLPPSARKALQDAVFCWAIHKDVAELIGDGQACGG